MSTRHCDVLLIGAGLAGLTAAERLIAAGADVRVLEAADRVGGRIRAETVDGTMLDTGAECAGRPHRRLRALLGSLGLHTRPANLDRAPIRWRLPDRERVSHFPPLAPGDLRHAAKVWASLRRQALTLRPGQPWTAPAATGLDAVSLAGWLADHGATQPGLDQRRAAVQHLHYGRATKLTATVREAPRAPQRSMLGGRPLAVAWRRGHTLAGIATTEATPEELAADLAAAFDLAPEHLADLAVTDWTQQPSIAGSYLVYAPGQLTQHAGGLRQNTSTRVPYAGADFSGWPNSMEGAAQSGHTAAASLLAGRGER